ncbi:MAG: YciI family protein [Mycoplasmatales bacterium]
MFIITLTYIKPLSEVDKYVVEHREYLDKFYSSNNLIVSGPKVPKTGGIIVAYFTDEKEVEQFILNDPFTLNEIAKAEYVRFDPVKQSTQIKNFLEEYND